MGAIDGNAPPVRWNQNARMQLFLSEFGQVSG